MKASYEALRRLVLPESKAAFDLDVERHQMGITGNFMVVDIPAPPHDNGLPDGVITLRTGTLDAAGFRRLNEQLTRVVDRQPSPYTGGEVFQNPARWEAYEILDSLLEEYVNVEGYQTLVADLVRLRNLLRRMS